MLVKKSRYTNAVFFSTLSNGSEVFPGFRARTIGDASGVIEHEVQVGDRLDYLARHYYNDDRFWWRIVDANPKYTFAANMLDKDMAGQVILIPKLKE